MDRPKLSDYNISYSQYSVYKEYKTQCEMRNKKLNKIEDNLFWVVAIIVYIGILFFYANSITDNFTKLPTLLKNVSEIINLTVLIVCVAFISFILFFTGLGILITGIISGILSLFKVHKLVMIFFNHFYKPPKKESYFTTIDFFESKEQAYREYIIALEKEYPDIANYNYDKKLYFKGIFDKILDYESKYINDIINQRNKKREEDYWLGLDGFKFEREVSDLYRKLGYKVETTRAVADGGVDIKLWNKEGEYIIVQCKNHKDKVGPAIVRDLFGTMHNEKADKAILLCSGGFNKSVFDFVTGKSIELVDIKQLINLSEKIYPLQYTNGSISNYSYLNNEINFLCKNIENVFILYSHYAKIIEKGGKKYFSSPIDDEYCIFETLEGINKEIELIKQQNNKPFAGSCIYDIAEWAIQDKTQYYRYKTFYYLRIIQLEQSYYKSKKQGDEKQYIKQNKRKYKKWRY
jgi:hypothetical protein